VNQAPTRNIPTEDKPHPYKQIMVGLMNQAPTRNFLTEDKPHLYKQIKVGLMNQDPYKKRIPYIRKIKTVFVINN
jgi:hypothetical protein